MSSSSSRRAINVVAPRFQSAVRKLCNDGVEALKPQLVVTTGPESKVWSRSRRPDDGVWRKPAISNRQMNVLRKQAQREGTYGSFDAETGQGWDPQWDIELAKHRPRGQGRFSLRVPKKSTHHRTREQRARKIEKSMEGMDEAIEEYYAAKHAAKPPKTFENHYKELMRVKK